MKATVRALFLSAATLSASCARPQAAAPPVATVIGDVERGHRVFDRMTCSNCHAPNGNGPDLRGEGKRARTGAWLLEQLRTPEKHDPHSIMPPQKLSETDERDLVAFLEASQSGDDTGGVTAAEGGKALFEARCRTCHFLPVPTTYSFTAAQWPAVVRFMLDGKKASRFITEAEAAKIIAYLQETARHRDAKEPVQ